MKPTTMKSAVQGISRTAYDRVTRIEVSAGTRGMARKALAAVLALLLCALIIWLARWDAARDRDRWWRHQIAAKSANVTRIMEQAGVTLPAADQRRIAELEAENAATKAELERLAAQRLAHPLSDPCNQCRIPADRLRLR